MSAIIAEFETIGIQNAVVSVFTDNTYREHEFAIAMHNGPTVTTQRPPYPPTTIMKFFANT